MEGLIICNLLVLLFAGIFSSIIFIKYLKAEKKLAKHNESEIFKKEEVSK